MSQLAVLAQAVVSLLTALLPTLTSWGQIPDEIIAALIQIIPIAVQEAEELVAPIQNIITALKSSSGVTATQMAQLETLQAQTDAAFEAAAKASGAPAPTPSGS